MQNLSYTPSVPNRALLAGGSVVLEEGGENTIISKCLIAQSSTGWGVCRPRGRGGGGGGTGTQQ